MKIVEASGGLGGGMDRELGGDGSSLKGSGQEWKQRVLGRD